MSWTYKYRGVDDAGLDERWDKVKGPKVEQKPKHYTMAEIARIREDGKKNSEPVPMGGLSGIPVPSYYNKLNATRYYLNNVVGGGCSGSRCYLTVMICGQEHHIYIPGDESWHWLRSVVLKKYGGDSNR